MHRIIAVPFDEELAAFIGKKGSVNSITFYNRNHEGNVVVAIMPSSIEEKFYALPEVLLVAKQVVLSTKDIDRNFGEALIACHLLGKKLLLTDDNDASQVVSFYPKDKIEIVDRESLLDKIFSDNEKNTGEKEGDLRIDVDKSFNVKGVGAVVLGIVSKGTVKKHDTLFHTSGKEVSVRSIQSQDQDIESAEEETRVGLALKGIEADEIEKGDVLSNKIVAKTNSISASVNISNFVSEDMQGKRYGFVSSFSYTYAVVESMNKNVVKLALEKPVAVSPGDKFLLMREKAPRIFAAGIVEA